MKERAKEKAKEKGLLWGASWFLWLLLLVLQIRLMLCFRGEQFGDYIEYVNKAKEVSVTRAFYPRAQDLYGVFYLHAPGYINFLSLVFRLTDHLRVLFCFNILFLQILLFSAKYIVYRLTGRHRCAEMFQILYCIYFSLGVGGGIVLANTEMPFCALVFLSMVLVMTRTGKRKAVLLAVAGAVMGIANWIRPVMIVFLPAVLWGLYQTNKKKMLRNTICYMASLLVCILCIGAVSYFNCGKFVYQSTTMGINLYIGNNPVADGNNHWDAVLNPELGGGAPIDSEKTADWTYEEWEDYFLHTALNYMKENPMRVIKLMPYRLFYLWAMDVYFAMPYADNEVDTMTTEYVMGIVDKVRNLRISELEAIDLLVILTECYYFFVLLLAVIGVVRQVRGKVWLTWAGIYSIVVLGTGMLMFMFGYGRFHFPYMIVMLMIAQGALIRPEKVIETNDQMNMEIGIGT